MITLKPWQSAAMSKIQSTLKGSIIEASTGSGKTILGLKIIEDNPKKKILIVVPTIVLQEQWRDEIIDTFKLAEADEISLIGGGNQDLPNGRITIAVIDSLRKVNWSHPLSAFDYVICDEVHRYGSEKNIMFLKQGSFGYILGLTATLQRSDGMEALLKKYIGPVVYHLDNEDSIDLGYISDYEVLNVKCNMNQSEAMKYSSVSEEVKRYMNVFNNDYNLARAIVRQGGRHHLFQHAVKLLKSVQERKQVITTIESKISTAIDICVKNNGKKIIIFDELQETTNKIYDKLNEMGMPAVIYHSGIKSKKAKQQAIEKFTSGEVNILLGCRSLDEGLNVSGAGQTISIGIIVNGNSQKRQILQRLGRILRKDEDGKVASLYMLYVPGTVDERYLNNRMDYLKKNSAPDDDVGD